MSSFIQAVDSFCLNKQIGENGHIEYGWSKSIQERICQLHFQCVRGNQNSVHNLSVILRGLLSEIRDSTHYLTILYKLIGQTRDIDQGKGERDLAYMMILVWYDFFPRLAEKALTFFVYLSPEEVPYGSWKDIKYFCNYVFSMTNIIDHPMITFAIQLICNQLKRDIAIADDANLSLCARWVPRESSHKFTWLFREIAITYLPEYIATANLPDSIMKAKKKTYMVFSKMVSSLNKRLDTVQIKMCGKVWATIDHNKTTSVTLHKNKKAFMNQSKNKATKNENDRIQCAENFEAYIKSQIKTGKSIKGKNVGLVDYVKNACDLCAEESMMEKTVLNHQWSDFMTKVGNLENMVAMVDQSGSMEGDPYYAAVGLGTIIANKSTLGKRIMTFSTEPMWVSLDGCSTFTDCIAAIKKADTYAGFSTDFFKALDMILLSCVKAKLSEEVVSNMILAIFSDMQIDIADRNYHSMQESIEIKYKEAGYSKVPHILFWNLQSTNGFPTVSTTKNCSMLSGFSPVLLNVFCQKGIDALKDIDPWTFLVESLDIPRFSVLVADL